MSTLLRNLRYAMRVLGTAPGFTAIAVLTLALGIGANTAIFSVVYAALLRPLPYSQPSRLITLTEVRDSGDQYWDSSYPDYLDWQRQSKTFSSLAGFTSDGFVLHGAGEPSLLVGAQATTNFFSTLGVKPMLGRDFAAGEDIASGPRVAILTYHFWRTHFAGDPNVIGKTLQLDANSVSIIGVLPSEFEFAPAGNTEIWVPLHLGTDMAGRRSLRWMPAIGRLAPGVTPAQARAEMNSINARLAAAYPQENSSIQVLMIPLRDRIVGQVQPLLLILFGAVGFVLLIACANVANLLMVRAAGRRREFAIRAALGASRGRLISQLLTESMILAAAGGVLGFLAAEWVTPLLIAAIPQAQLDSMPFLRDAHANPVVLAFLCAAAIFTGLLFGLAPAWQISHERVSDALKEETSTSAGGVRTRLRDALVVTEIAFSLVLLVSAGLMVKSLGALLQRNPGFDTQNVLTFAVNLPDASYPKNPDYIRFDKTFTDRLRGAPGILGIGNTSIVPLTGGGNTVRFLIEGQPMPAGHEYESNIRDVSVDYFSTMKIPLVAGRLFNDAADSPDAPKHVIVNQAWVKQYLHGRNAIGKRFKFTFSATQPYREIVGVVGNIADADLDSPEAPALFLPFTQAPNSFINYVVRTGGNPVASLGQVREALRQIDPQLFPVQPLTMEQIIGQSPSVFLRRYPSYLIGSFAVLALLLATIGLYGLISYSVSQRTREMGIRIALGAQQRDLLRLVMGQGTRLVLVGVGIGVAAGLGLTQLMRSLLYGVSAADPFTFAGVAIILIGVALLACYIPARRAMRTDPMVALRYE
ncbi:MAG: ABC transporter permease [Candidatus Acidiferrales bacterium]